MVESNPHTLRSSPLSWIDERLEQIDAQHLRRFLKERGSAQAAKVVIDGKSVVNFSSNDYLGIANDPRLIQAANEAAEKFGWGSGASPLITGHSELHRQLEEALATFEQTEAALLFPTGYAANIGTITALADEDTIIFSDAKNHASIIDGCRLSGGTIRVYEHGDCDHLESQLKEFSDRRTAKQKFLIVTDGLFSMDGDLAPLRELTRIAESYNAMLMVDEAHATGVLGSSGRGTCEHFGIQSDCIIKVGTLSKALGSFGGFVCGPRKLVDWLVNRSRTLIFSTAAPAAVCAAGLAALKIVQEEPERREHLAKLSGDLRERLITEGFRVGHSETQIIPVMLEDPARTMRVSGDLRSAGYLVPGIRPPSVPKGESLLRISLSHDHTEAMVSGLVDAMTSGKNNAR